MTSNINHLPEKKQAEIYEILDIIVSAVKPEKVILFGSHARGDWVEDMYVEHGAIFTYMSDYDFLIIINKVDQKEHEIISKIINNTSNRYRNIVSPIVHDIDYVNYGLEHGQYFFSDIIKEGILIYDTKQFEFAEVKLLDQREQREEAKLYYNEWCESGVRMLAHTKASFELAVNKGFVLNEVIFFLHQTAEKLYSGVSLVFTGYKPKTHSIDEFRKYTKYISEELNRVFCYPIGNTEEERLFNILQKSYIDARYKPNYKIVKEDLAKLIQRVEVLESTVIELCKQRIKNL